MKNKPSKCRITVLKRIIRKELAEEYLDDESKGLHPCECFTEGQEFIIDLNEHPNEFFNACAWAWADVRHDILSIAYGGDIPGYKDKGVAITGCTDWFRPVIFKIERVK